MPDLFGLDIKGIVADAITSAGGLVSGTLTEIVTGARTGDITGGKAHTETVHTFTDGILSGYSDDEINGTTIQKGDQQILIIAGSLSSAVVPETNWKVAIEGKTYRVVNVSRDPAEATYALQVRSP